MNRFVILGLASLAAATSPGVAPLAFAQPAPAAAPASGTPPASAPTPAPPPATPATPAGAPSNPNLTVATVTMQGGTRISKLMGSEVYNDQNEKIGTIDDLILKDGNQIVMAVVSVGGFLGIGNRLVAVPYTNLHVEANNNNHTKVVMPGATKDAVGAMPSFTYSS